MSRMSAKWPHFTPVFSSQRNLFAIYEGVNSRISECFGIKICTQHRLTGKTLCSKWKEVVRVDSYAM